jgi:hypothetical protein
MSNTDTAPMDYEVQRIPSPVAERNRQRLIAERVISPEMTWADHLFADVAPDQVSGVLERALGDIDAAVRRATRSEKAHEAVAAAIQAARGQLGIPAEVTAAAAAVTAPVRRRTARTDEDVGTGSAGPDNPQPET